MVKLLVWIARVLAFFVLFAFAINNRQEVTLHWFFGYAWQAEMILVVLAVFAAGCAVGLISMLPAWWKYRSIVKAQQASAHASSPVGSVDGSSWVGSPPAEHPPRDGL